MMTITLGEIGDHHMDKDHPTVTLVSTHPRWFGTLIWPSVKHAKTGTFWFPWERLNPRRKIGAVVQVDTTRLDFAATGQTLRTRCRSSSPSHFGRAQTPTNPEGRRALRRSFGAPIITANRREGQSTPIHLVERAPLMAQLRQTEVVAKPKSTLRRAGDLSFSNALGKSNWVCRIRNQQHSGANNHRPTPEHPGGIEQHQQAAPPLRR